MPAAPWSAPPAKLKPVRDAATTACLREFERGALPAAASMVWAQSSAAARFHGREIEPLPKARAGGVDLLRNPMVQVYADAVTLALHLKFQSELVALIFQTQSIGYVLQSGGLRSRPPAFARDRTQS